MGIPPSNIPPGGSTSASRSSESDKGKPKKDFRLPEKKGAKDDETEKPFDLLKKKGPKDDQSDFGQMADLAKQQALAEGKVADATKAELSAVEAKAAITKIAEIIFKLVAQMQVGAVGGKNFASLDLKGTADIPAYLQNTSLYVTQTAEGISIRFTNFESPQQQALAIAAIEQNKEQLTQLMLNLQTKNIAVADMTIGTHTVNLPRIEPLPPPFRPEPPARADTEAGERQRQRDEGGAGPGPSK